MLSYVNSIIVHILANREKQERQSLVRQKPLFYQYSFLNTPLNLFHTNNIYSFKFTIIIYIIQHIKAIILCD